MLRPHLAAAATSRKQITKKRDFSASRNVQSSPTTLVYDALQALHSVSGTPWSLTIPLATISLSLLTFPIARRSRTNALKITALKPIVDAQIPGLAQQVRQNASPTHFDRLLQQSIRVKRTALHRKHGVSLRYILALPAMKLPLWLAFSFTLRAMAGAPISFFEAVPFEHLFHTEGFGIISDLTLPDRSLVLPVLFGVVNLANVEINCHGRIVGRIGKILENVLRFVSIAFIPIACQMPAAVCLYWTTSSVFTMLQNIYLNHIYPIPADQVKGGTTESSFDDGNKPSLELPKIDHEAWATFRAKSASESTQDSVGTCFPSKSMGDRPSREEKPR